jgi:hypothetical protein
MITGNIIHRVFRISWNHSRGTAFAIEVDGREYLVTARHVVESITAIATIGVFRRNRFDDLGVKLVGLSSPEADIAVLAADMPLAVPNLPAEPSANGIVYGQDVYFLGFPYDFLGEVTLTPKGYPLPFVKKAIVSQMDLKTLMLDGHNNPGFSGGPVVFTAPGEKRQKIAGVISGYRCAPEPVFHGDLATQFTYRHNTGIIVANSIDAALELIRARPIGTPLG